ncbi:MAG: hypothetical protein IJ583_00125 [Firmicutes bacterium]|nr:hypothetical protein [Bacillota bacterium]MBR1441922.1 hypothetical protein [Bacillota bacterium]
MSELTDYLRQFSIDMGITPKGDPPEEETPAPAPKTEKTAEQIEEEKAREKERKAREEREREEERKATEEREKREKEIAGLQKVAKIKSEWESQKAEIQEELKDFTGLKKLLNRKKYNELTAKNTEIEENLEKLSRSLKARFGSDNINKILFEREKPKKSLNEVLKFREKIEKANKK